MTHLLSLIFGVPAALAIGWLWTLPPKTRHPTLKFALVFAYDTLYLAIFHFQLKSF
jgi:hypothetical protein